MAYISTNTVIDTYSNTDLVENMAINLSFEFIFGTE